MRRVKDAWVLLVDDDLHSREGLKLFLMLDGYRVRAVGDAWQAIRAVKEGSLDLAIIDLDLPPFRGVEITGWDLARIVRAYQPDLAIIVVGAEDGADVRRQAAAAGVTLFLEKPISPVRIRAIVRQLRPWPPSTNEMPIPA